MSDDRTANEGFLTLAQRVVWRLTVTRWLEALSKTAWPVFAVLAIGVIALRVADVRALPLFGEHHFLAGVSLVLAWVLGTAGVCWLLRPSPVQALARWDEVAGHQEMFVSAYCFETSAEEETPGVALHLRRAREQVTQAATGIARDLPWQVRPVSWAMPILFLGLALTPFLQREVIATPSENLSEAERLRAEKVGQSLDDRAGALDNMKGLTEEEKKARDELKKKLAESAEKMKKLGEKDKSRKVLEELEKRAREAERLAEKMGAGKEKVSEGMLAELERHADTTELAGALRGQKLGKASKEAAKLAGKLADKQLTHEARERIAKAFQKGLKKATKEDKQTALGKHLQKAHAGLKKKEPQKAAKELKKLAQIYKKRAQRLKSLKKLKQLAKTLRKAGQKVFGRKQGIKRLGSGKGLKGLKRISGVLPKLPMGGNNNAPPAPPMPQGPQKLIPLQPPGQPPVPGQKGKMPPAGKWKPGGKPGNWKNRPPIPGQGPMGPWRPGGKRPGQGGMPVPGQGGVPGGMQPGGQGGAPIPGAGGGGQGGHQAGSGSAPYGKDKTKAIKAKKTGVVAGSPGEGPSAVRTLDGKDHREGSARSLKNVARKFLKAEEEALADDPLPVSRREQVLRYFRSIRKQLEKNK